MKLLVAGGSGRVGTLLLPYLARCHELSVLDPEHPKGPCARHLAGDAADAELLARALQDCEALIYLISQPSAGERWAHVELLDRVLESAHRQGVQKAVCMSSMNVYGSLLHQDQLTEDSPTLPDTLYGRAKLEGEEICRGSPLPTVCLRLYWPLTWWEWQRAAALGRLKLHTCANDLADCVERALALTSRDNVVINVCGDGRVCGKAREILGWEPRVRPLPVFRFLAYGLRKWRERTRWFSRSSSSALECSRPPGLRR